MPSQCAPATCVLCLLFVGQHSGRLHPCERKPNQARRLEVCVRPLPIKRLQRPSRLRRWNGEHYGCTVELGVSTARPDVLGQRARARICYRPNSVKILVGRYI